MATLEEIALKEIKSKEALLFLWKHLKKDFLPVFLGILCLIAADFTQIVIYRIVGNTVDALSSLTVMQKLIIKNSLIILSLAIFMAIIRFLWRYFIIGNSRKKEREIRRQMFNHLQTLSFSFFNKTKTGDLMALLINDLSAVQRTLGFGIVTFIDIIFLGSMALVAMFNIDAKLTLITITPLPIIVFIMIFFGRLIEEKFSKVQESFSTISAHAQESFSGVRVLKGFLQEEEDSKSFYKDSEDYVERNIDLVKIWGFFFPSINFLASLSTCLFYLFGLKGIILKSISIGQALAFLSYLNMIVWPMMGIGFVFNMLSRGLASTKRILALLNTEPEIVDREVVQLEKIEGDVKIQNLTFAYDKSSKPVLKNINIHIERGSSLGIMGKPGSGKSTLVSLLFHLFPVPENSIFIDGYDINEIPLNVIRKAIGYVPQDSFLFSDTLANNIALGIPEDKIDMEKIINYAKIAAIHDDIMELKDGYSTVIGERGITLSGGQKQRVSIARALICEPSILILDDALSAVDAQTERTILNLIRKEIEKRTSIIIAHRISTVKDCDNIIVIEDGSIIEQGTHSQLIKNKGYYSRLYDLQRLAEDLKAEKEA